MSKVLTFSRFFPAYHPKAVHPTYFVEKILKSLDSRTTYFISECEWCGWRGMSSLLVGGGQISDTGDFEDCLCPSCKSNKVDESDENRLEIVYYNQDESIWPKYHTIRSGNRWKVGDKFSPRVWSGTPRRSKQITIAPDIEIKKVWDVEVIGDTFFISRTRIVSAREIAENDGLLLDDLLSWFNKPFSGQIICWSDKINY